MSQNAPSIMTDTALRYSAGRMEGERVGSASLLPPQGAGVQTVVRGCSATGHAAEVLGRYDFRDHGAKYQMSKEKKEGTCAEEIAIEM